MTQFDFTQFTKNSDGTYSKAGSDLKFRAGEYWIGNRDKKTLVEYLPFNPHKDKSILTINELIPGLNGDKGLMRSHWTKIKKTKQHYKHIISTHLQNGSIHRHPGKVKITYTGHKSILMDWDNFCASFKHIGDALVDSKIIIDDKPSIVVQFAPQQIKCKRKEQKVVITIEDFNIIQPPNPKP